MGSVSLSMSMMRRLRWLVLLGGCVVGVGWGGWVWGQAAKPPAPPQAWWAQPMKVDACAWAGFGSIYNPNKLFRPEFGVTVQDLGNGRLLVHLEHKGYVCQLQGQAGPGGREIVLDGGQTCELSLEAADFCVLRPNFCGVGLKGLRCEQQKKEGHLGVAKAWLNANGNRMWRQPDGKVRLELNASVNGCVLAHHPPSNPVKVVGGSVEVGDCQDLERKHVDDVGTPPSP